MFLSLLPRVLLSILLGWTSLAWGAGEPMDVASSGRPALRVFTDKDGLPQNSIEGLVVDSQGYLWVGTQDGAAYYNGHHWTSVQLPDRRASQWIRSMIATKDGSLWFGREQGGVCRLKDGVWTRFDTQDGLPSTKVLSLLACKDGTLLAGTSAGVARFDQGRWKALSDPEGHLSSGVLGFFEGSRPQGTVALWVGTEKGLGLLENGHWRWFTSADGLPHSTVGCVLETQDDDGHFVVWAGTNAGLAKWDGKTWSVDPKYNPFPLNSVNRILEARDPQGRRSLWITTEHGLGVREHGQWRIYDTKSGFPNTVVRSLLVNTSPEGVRTVWAGTFGGLVRMVSGTWVTFDIQSGMPDNVAFALGETSTPSSFWMGFLGGGLARFENGNWKAYGMNSEVPDRLIMCILPTQDERGRPVLWIGTRGGGLLRMEDGRWTRFTEKDGLPDSWIYSLYQRARSDGKLELWVGTRYGAARRVDGQWTSFSDGKLIPRNSIMTFRETTAPDGHKQFWIASRGAGLIKEEEHGWKTITTADGLCDPRVTALLETHGPDGHWLWAGTYDGLCRLRLDGGEARWETLGSDGLPVLPSQLIYQLRQDAKGRIFVFTHRGVTRLTPRGSTAQTPFEVYTYTTGDGLPSNGCTMASGYVDAKGRLWTGTVAGAAMLDLDQESHDRTPKPLLLEKIRLGTREHPLTEPLSLPWPSPRLVFEFALLSYFREEDTRYRTQLVGLESQPSDWTPDPKREFSTLPAGTYQFKVWARDFAGNESGPILYKFKVRPALWFTWWAILLEVVGGLGIVFWAIRHRTTQLLEHNQELEANVVQRTQELLLANEALRNQSLTDPLTGLRNRRYLGVCMPEDIALIQRRHRDVHLGRKDRASVNVDLVFTMVDIDHFKVVNDEYGHAAGDLVLKKVAELLQDAMRTTDTVIRWGGEEFLVVARNAARQDSAVLMERIRTKVASHVFEVGEGHTLRCTCSLGFTIMPFQSSHPELFDWARLVDLADRCLYAAKRGGRNAWVGLIPPEETDPEVFAKRLPHDIPGLQAEGLIQVLSSIRDVTTLDWEQEHKY